MIGSRGWLKRRKASGLRYYRMFGYASEDSLRRWRRLRRLQGDIYSEALKDAHSGLGETSTTGVSAIPPRPGAADSASVPAPGIATDK